MNRDEMIKILKQAGLEIEPSDEDFTKTFSEIGLDSLDVFSLLSAIEDTFERQFSEEEYAQSNNLNDIIRLVNSK